MSKKDFSFEARVKEIHKTYYLLELIGDENLEGKEVRATLSGKMRMNKIRVIIGDRVTVQLDEYDLKKGRITYRTK